MTGRIYKSPCGRIELREGRWQDVLADLGPDHVISDPPYGERCHRGHDAVAGPNDDGECGYRELGYDAWTSIEVCEFVSAWGNRCTGWIVGMTSHDLIPAWEYALDLQTGRYTFSPLAFIVPGSRFRKRGDGPAQWSVFVIASRPRTAEMAAWGSLPGGYVVNKELAMGRVGGKPLLGMCALVRDYSRPGELICDPCAGAGTTLIAAAIEGRRAIGAEAHPETYDLAVRRLSAGYTPDMFQERMRHT